MLWIGLHLPGLSLESFSATLGLGGPAADGSAGTGTTEPPAARPVVLVHDGRIVQADATARARGIRPGMKRPTAQAIATDLVLGQADAWRDAQALQAVLHVALAFTPSVADGGHHTVLLEVQTCLRYFGGQQRLLQRLQAALAPLGHRLRLACAPSARAAAMLARWRPGFEQGPHCTDLQALRALLDSAPVWLLGPGREHWEALQGMGLRTVADLRALPRSGVARRFSPELLLELDQARAEAPEPMTWATLPLTFSSRLELFARADHAEQVLAGARILLARLVAWAQGRHGRIGRFTLVMHHEPRHRADSSTPATTALPIEPAEPSADITHLQMLLAERLGRLPLPAPALELGIHCDRLVPGAAPNTELFPTRASEQAGLTRLVERLQARLGRERVRTLALERDHRPECATVTQPVQPARAGRPAPADAALAERLAAVRAHVLDGLAEGAEDAVITRPAWLLPEPLPLLQRLGVPWLDGQPLILLDGPERIETGWWDEHLVLRDYFIACTPEGALLWLFRSRLPPPPDASGGWFLHGRFG